MYHAVIAIRAAVYSSVAFLDAAVYVVSYTVNHAVIGRFGVHIVQCKLLLVLREVVTSHDLRHAYWVVVEVCKKLVCYHSRHLLTLVVVHILGIVHGFGFRGVIAVVVTFITGLCHRVLLSILNLTLLRTHNTLVLLCCLDKVQHTHTEFNGQICIVHDLTESCFLFLVGSDKERVTPSSPFLHYRDIVTNGIINDLSCIRHFIECLSLRTTIRECLCTSEETAHKTDTEEGVHILIPVKHTSTFCRVKRVVTHKQGVLYITNNLFCIFSNGSIPFCMLFEIINHMRCTCGSNIINKLIDFTESYLIHTLACQRRCLAEEWCKIFTHHFRMVLDGLCTKCLHIGFQHTVLCTLTTTIHNLTAVVHLELHIASQTIKHVCGNVSLPSRACHSH